MRTLLIDNHDSYTYNLFQLLAEVNGSEPVVLTHDDPRLRHVELGSFDNVVISPGPGHPARDRDFGAAASVVADARVPLLGVCLGHQGIAVAAGGTVRAAPRARHGHLTAVTHDGRGLFDGIPQGFTAVRYHSLCVDAALPTALEATAWAEDGVVMAIRHRERPQWGVQFHPESVETRFGLALVRNFADLTRRHQAARRDQAVLSTPGPAHNGRPQDTHTSGGDSVGGRMASERPAAGTGAAGHSEAAGAGAAGHAEALPRPQVFRLRVRTVGRAVDTERVFDALFSASPQAFWLDSARVEPGLSRFSFLGDGSGPLAESLTYRVGSGHVEAVGADGVPRRIPGSVFDHLKRQLRRRIVSGPELPFDFRCGYVGYFGYELRTDCGSATRFRSPTPDARWLFADRLVAVDHEADTTHVLALDDGTATGAADSERWLDATAATLARLPRTEPARATPAPTGTLDPEPWLARDRARYVADIESCRRQLLAGESYEICLTNSLRVPSDDDGIAFYRRLRRHNPAPYGAYLKWDGMEIACSSPERFLKVDREWGVEAKPIKGTAPRGATPGEDRLLAKALATSAKTRAENLMIVDLLRNDLGRVCEPGSVTVPRLMAVESYTTVHQLVSTITGRLKEGLDAIDCIRAAFPGGSMTGAPKKRTMEIIDSLEGHARGVYSGAIGYLGCDGTADLNIVIRTAVLFDGAWHIGAGGAIVLDSDPAEEYAEMLLKAHAPLRALSPPAAPGGPHPLRGVPRATPRGITARPVTVPWSAG
ncbi:aminodeoxychorismate synthase component I [Streptomyces sp. NPDC050560]|uniref:aminodeoxychorismate synthase component I n=1 Tax=Streptomyces sp. NPDC050560 TaxID=3365630 RepID=UPI00378DAC3D